MRTPSMSSAGCSANRNFICRFYGNSYIGIKVALKGKTKIIQSPHAKTQYLTIPSALTRDTLGFKSRKGIALVAALAIIIVLSAFFYLSRSEPPSIPSDQVETIVVRREDEPSFDLSPTSEEGRRLLSKCEDVLLNLTSGALGIPTDGVIAELKEEVAYVEIVFKDNYDVPIRCPIPPLTQMPSSKVMFILSGKSLGHFPGEVLFRATWPSLPMDNYLAFVWRVTVVLRNDNVGWPILQELVEMVNEIQRL